MSRILSLLFFAVFVFAQSGYWDYEHSYTLQKDQVARISIKKDYPPTKKDEGILKFRWTLFKADKLVLLTNYEGFPVQHLLEKRYRRDTIKVVLLGDNPTISKEAFAIIKFKDFKNNKASFDVMIRDPQKRLEVRFR